MHVQRVAVPGNQAESWTVLDDDGRVVERWLAPPDGDRTLPEHGKGVRTFTPHSA